MLMPGRQFSIGKYRFGFNGKENDNEVKGVAGSQQDYGFRIYDPRLGRFLSVDPITKDYPWYTPYQFAGNKPIAFIDLDGLEECKPKLTKFQHWLAFVYKKQIVLERHDDVIITQTVNGNGDVIHQSTIKLRLGPNVKQEFVTDHSAKVIEKALQKAGKSEVTITSAKREPIEQAKAMYDNIQGKGLESQYALYGPPGEKVLNIYEHYTPEQGCSKDECTTQMAEAIKRVGPVNVSKHASDPKVLNTIDMKVGDNQTEFNEALRSNTGKGKDIQKYIPPGKGEPANHVEIPQPKN